jgi:hypothetical protein
MGERARRRRRGRSLSERNVPATSYLGPGMYGPGQEHQDAPLTERARTVWNIVIYALVLGAVVFFALTAIFHWF